MAQRAGARATPVPGGHDVERLLAAVTPRHARDRALQPERPDRRAPRRPPRCATLLDALPEHVSLLLDEALADFVTARGRRRVARAARRPPAPADLPHLLEGLRARRPARRLRARRPRLGGAAGADRAGAGRRPAGAGRRARGAAQMRRASSRSGAPPSRPSATRLLDALHELPLDARPSEANVLWLRPTGLSGGELAHAPAAQRRARDERRERRRRAPRARRRSRAPPRRTACSTRCAPRSARAERRRPRATRTPTGAAACRSSARGSCASAPSARARRRSA